MSKALEYFKEVYDVVPGWVQKMHDYSPEVLDKYTGIRGEIMQDGSLSRKEKDALIASMNAARLYSRSMLFHTKGAVDFGYSASELLEFFLTAYLYKGDAALKRAFEAIPYALELSGKPVVLPEATPETAEAIKYVANTMLLTYISFWNGVGAKLGEKISNVNIDDLRLGVTADDRISTWGSFVSNGAGGSCFGKDIASLIYQLRRLNVSTKMLEASYEVNEYQKVYLVDRAINEANFKFNNKTVAVLGLAFKKHTNDMRDASSIKVVEALLGKGVSQINAYDPLANATARQEFDPSKNVLFEKIKYCESAKEAIKGTQALFISSDCEEFRGFSRTIEDTVQPPYLIMDGRRMIPDYGELVSKNYSYLAVGSVVMCPA